MPLMRLTPRANPADHVDQARAFSEAIQQAGIADDRGFAYLVAPSAASPATAANPNKKADTDSGGGDGGDGKGAPTDHSTLVFLDAVDPKPVAAFLRSCT